MHPTANKKTKQLQPYSCQGICAAGAIPSLKIVSQKANQKRPFSAFNFASRKVSYSSWTFHNVTSHGQMENTSSRTPSNSKHWFTSSSHFHN